MTSRVQTPLTEKTPIQPTKTPLWIHYFQLTRLHKFPLGSILIFWPAAWALTMAAHSTRLPIKSLATETVMFAIGSTLLHSAACVLNDICDIDFDRQVERTKNRPLVTGAVSIPGAVLLLFALCATSMAMLLMTNTTAALCGLIGVFPLHALYPLMKRWTWWPQVWLGFAMNWSLPVAWISVTGEMDTRIVTVFLLGTVCWTVVYDTIYACQDRQDDAKAGVKSTALLFGARVRLILSLVAVIFLSCLTYAGRCNHQGLPFYVISVGGSVLYFFWQFSSWKVENPADCGYWFKANGDILGYIIWGGLALDYYLKVM